MTVRLPTVRRRRPSSPSPGVDACDARFRALIQHASDVIAILAADGTVLYKSPAVTRVLGYTPDELVGTDPFALVHLDDVAAVLATFQAVIDHPQAELAAAFRYRHKNGSWRWLEAIGTNLLADQNVAGIVVNYRDITERKAVETALAHQAFHDPLTGLPNRTRFLDHLAQSHPPLALLYLDVDGFKVVNDSLGHAAGDELLCAVGQRLTGCLRPEVMVARLGGDEFAILLTVDAALPEAEAIASRVLDALRSPVAIDHREAFVTASIGIAATTSETTTGDLLRAADIALYHAKALGRAQYAVFTPALNDAALARLEMETDLRRAVVREELRLHYQPKVGLATGHLVGVEALVRWERPGHGLVHPDDFLPLAEETGLILPLGRWVLAEACRQAREWETKLPAGVTIPICVNLGPPQLRQPDLVAQVAAVLDATGVAPHQLTLEITERVLAGDFTAASQVLRDLRGLGVRLAIDDFGTGSSSLSFLERLATNIDMLKLDRSFVHGLGTDTVNRTIVSAIVTLAHALDLEVTIEGIETATEWAAARDVGGDFGQGYYIAPPLLAGAVVGFLARHEIA